MLERFHWRRLGGSVFRYEGIRTTSGLYEDWLNHVAPALSFFRAYILKHGLTLTYFTIDAGGTSFLDMSDPTQPLGTLPVAGATLPLATPTNAQSSETALRNFVDSLTAAVP